MKVICELLNFVFLRRAGRATSATQRPRLPRSFYPAIIAQLPTVGAGTQLKTPQGSFMATKRTPPAQRAHAEPPQTVAVGLRHSETPGVFLNEFNIPCDEDGVALSFKQVKARDMQRFEDVIGEAADTPAKFLKAVSLDPRVPMSIRIDAAKAAAPYTDRKQPTALDGGQGPNGQSLPLFDFSKLSNLSDKELGSLRTLIDKAEGGV